MTQSMRALVVEDNPSWQQLLHEMLADEGLEVDLAPDLATALTALRSSPHRLAIVDLSLGDDEASREGLEVLTAARRLDPGCITVLLSGYATVEIAVSALSDYGAYTCLRKESFRRSDFRDLMRRTLALAPAADVLPQPAVTGEPDVAGSVLLVEDDAGWRAILTEILSDAGHRVVASPSYAEALGHLRRARFDATVVDLGLASSTDPDRNRDGYEVLREAASARLPALVVTGLATPADVERAYTEFDVFACLEKRGFERRAFLEAVAGALAAGRAGPGELALLTGREREVLALLAEGLTNKGIALAMSVSPNTVKRYLKSIFEKLGVDSRAGAVARALSSGLRPR